MKHFTIDAENTITVHASKEAARETGEGVFASAEQLAELIGTDNKRLVEIWNSLAGVTPVTKFANRKVATERIWKAIQSLGDTPDTAGAAEPEAATMEVEDIRETGIAPAPIAQEQQDSAAAPETPFDEVPEPSQEPAQPEQPVADAVPEEIAEPADALVEQPAAAEPVASVGAQVPDVAPAAAEPTKEATPAKKAPKAKKAAKPAKTETGPKTESGPREGSKAAQVVAMLKREGGVTITEIMPYASHCTSLA